MYFSEFLVIMLSAIILTLVLMVIGEKVITLLIPTHITPLIKIVGSFAFTILLISITLFGLNLVSDISIYLLSGGIILLNKYWFGHFSAENTQ